MQINQLVSASFTKSAKILIKCKTRQENEKDERWQGETQDMQCHLHLHLHRLEIRQLCFNKPPLSIIASDQRQTEAFVTPSQQ